MRIILSGAQCTGKTSILREIEERQRQNAVHAKPKYLRLSDYRVIKEVVRELMKEKGITINKDADHTSQCLILEQHYKNCLREQDFISDRGSIDAFVYATWSYLHGKFTLAEHIEHEQLFLRSLPYYDYIFYLPVEFEIKEDGVRSVDRIYQSEITKIYESVFSRYAKQLPKVVRLTGNIPTRVDRIFAEIGPSLVK